MANSTDARQYVLFAFVSRRNVRRTLVTRSALGEPHLMFLFALYVRPPETICDLFVPCGFCTQMDFAIET